MTACHSIVAKNKLLREQGIPESHVFCVGLGRKNPVYSEIAFTLSQEFHLEDGSS